MKTLTREAQVLRIYPAPGVPGAPKAAPARGSYATPPKPGDALPRTSAGWKTTTYVPTRFSPMRPGAEDFLACPSRSGDNYFYPLTGERR